MKLKVEIKKIGALVEGTTKDGYAYARRTVAVSYNEKKDEQTTLRHTLTCELKGDFARMFEEKVKLGTIADAEILFYVDSYNFRDYQKVKMESIDLETAEAAS